MTQPLFVRSLTDAEHTACKAGLRSADGFVRRRSQILLASVRGERAPAIAQTLGCDDETVRTIIKGFNHQGLGILKAGSRRPHKTAAAFTPAQAEALKELLHKSPRTYGKASSVWTLALAAEVSFAQGLTATEVSGETIRATLKRLDLQWTRAKHWLTSPDPAYARKKKAETASSA